MSCNRSWLRELGRQCYFLNLAIASTGGTETRGNERAQDTPTRRHIYPRFFLLDPSGSFTWRNSFFLQREEGVGVCMRTRFVMPLVRHRTNGMYRINIFIRSIRFLGIVLVRLRNEKPDVSHFFYPIHPICSYSKFVLIRGPTLQQAPKSGSYFSRHF